MIKSMNIYSFGYGDEYCPACNIKFASQYKRRVLSMDDYVLNTCGCCKHEWRTKIKKDWNNLRIGVLLGGVACIWFLFGILVGAGCNGL